jgi:hypothetical protein
VSDRAADHTEGRTPTDFRAHRSRSKRPDPRSDVLFRDGEVAGSNPVTPTMFGLASSHIRIALLVAPATGVALDIAEHFKHGGRTSSPDFPPI